MRREIRFIATCCSIIILVLFVLFVVNQTAGIVTLGGAYHPLLGTVLLWTLLAVYATLIGIPLVLYLRMPAVLRPPADDRSREFEAYLDSLRRRLARNSRLAGRGLPLDTRDDIARALGVLDAQADDLTKSTASTMFVSTAISQNGRLDAIMVLIAQARMIWGIARIYHQRPSARDMLHLYANVAATAFVADAIEELDIEEQIEPIITPLVSGSVVGGIPGASGISTFMTTSIVDGAANALLTLRVGIITRRYFGMAGGATARETRRAASLEAGTMLMSIVVASSAHVTEAIVKASRKRIGTIGGSLRGAAVHSAGTMTQATKKSARTVIDAVRRPNKRP